MAGSPSPVLKDALRTLGTAARGMGKADLIPPVSLRDDEAIRAWITANADAFKQARRTHARELLVCEAKVTAGRSARDGSHVAAWQALDDAVNRLEGELNSMSSLKARLAEGRRSMTAKASRTVEENLNVRTAVVGGKVEGSLEPAGVQALQAELPRWVLAWADYSYKSYAVDLHRITERLWLPRTGTLPVPAPTIAPLALPAPPRAPEFPTISQTADLEGMGGVLKHARTMLYAAMSLAMMFGLRTNEEYETLFQGFMFVVLVFAILYGVQQYKADKAARIERFETDVSRRAEQAVKDVLRTWYDRQADQLLDHAVAQLHQRRATLVQWYQKEVLPAKQRAEQATNTAREEASKAQSQLGMLQRQKADHEKAKAAIASVLG